jgi:CHAT domain-containing protein
VRRRFTRARSQSVDDSTLTAWRCGDPLEPRRCAAAFFERSIGALESQTVRLGGSDEVRAAFAGQTHDYYKEYIETLPIGEQALREQVKAFRDAIERHQGVSHLPVVDHVLHLFDVLIAPALAAVAAADRVLISPDGPLHNLPFAALARLREQTSEAVGRSHQYLIEWKPVHTVVSVTVYADLKRARPAVPTPATLVAFGDPRYTSRTSATKEIANLELRDVIRSGYTLEPLPATRTEVNAIAELFGDRATTYLGAEATEERAKSVRSARYLHFATHGLSRCAHATELRAGPDAARAVGREHGQRPAAGLGDLRADAH